MYNVGDIVFYGNEGVCRLESVDKLDVAGIDKEKLYYNLSPVYQGGNIYVPIDTKMFMRPAIQWEEAQDIIRLIPSLDAEPVFQQNRKLLEEQYNRYMQTHDCMDWVRIIKSICRKESIIIQEKKHLGAIDERFRKKAEDLLSGELAIALQMKKEEVRKYLEKKLRKKEPVRDHLINPGQARG